MCSLISYKQIFRVLPIMILSYFLWGWESVYSFKTLFIGYRLSKIGINSIYIYIYATWNHCTGSVLTLVPRHPYSYNNYPSLGRGTREKKTITRVGRWYKQAKGGGGHNCWTMLSFKIPQILLIIYIFTRYRDLCYQPTQIIIKAIIINK